jgi:predicted transcriptional regulator
MASPMRSVTLRMPVDLRDAVDATAAARHATRSAVIRAVLEDAIDAGELPNMPTQQELLDRDDEFERLRDLSRR